jgi:hypothetical protein
MPGSVTRIGTGAFRNNKFVTLTIPEGVRIIGRESFKNNKLKAITIPDSVISIANEAFAGSKPAKIIIGPRVVFKGKAPMVLGFAEISVETNVILKGKIFVSLFDEFYLANERKAGTYLFIDGSWKAEFR